MQIDQDRSRFDFEIGEDCHCISVGDTRWQDEIQSKQDRLDAAQQNKLFAIPMPESGGISGRLVFGSLNAEESENWVARACRTLSLETGELVIDAGGFYGQTLQPGSESGPDFQVVKVPADTYQVTVHVSLVSNIATHLLKQRQLSYITWYQSSHAREKIPHWLFEIAADRDSELEEAILEKIEPAEIDFDAPDCFVEVLVQLESTSSAKDQTEISASGKPKWEVRIPAHFPQPLSLSVPGLQRAESKAKSCVAAFRAKEFARASDIFVAPIRNEVAEFLSNAYRSITEKMPLPVRTLPGESRLGELDWQGLYDDANSLVYPPALRRNEFHSTQVFTMADPDDPYQDVRVDFKFGFVRTSDGLEVAGVVIKSQFPKSRKRRRKRK